MNPQDYRLALATQGIPLLAPRGLKDVKIVRVAFTDLWLVPSKTQVRMLTKHGISRAHIWTLAEVQNFLEACGSPVSSLEEAAHLLGSECPGEGTAEG